MMERSPWHMHSGKLLVSEARNKAAGTVTYTYTWGDIPVVGISLDLFFNSREIVRIDAETVRIGPWLCKMVSIDHEAVYVQRMDGE